MKIIVDSSNASLGRTASYVAKQALLGKEVVVVNCSEAFITGDIRMIINEYRQAVLRGGHAQNGPNFVKRNPERLMKRTIRGMLSYKQGRGDAAFKRIKCYNSIPKEYANEKMIKFESKLGKGMKLNDLAKEL